MTIFIPPQGEGPEVQLPIDSGWFSGAAVALASLLGGVAAAPPPTAAGVSVGAQVGGPQ